MASQEHNDAVMVVGLIRKRIQNSEGPIHGYSVVAEMIGRKNASRDGRYMGQVTSRIDAASFIAGLPMMALHFVRKPTGKINEKSFDEQWDRVAPEGCKKEDLILTSTLRQWCEDDCDTIIRALHSLPNEKASTIWKNHLARGSEFIQYNLHRKLRAKSQ